jgi:hypothetical protein
MKTLERQIIDTIENMNSNFKLRDILYVPKTLKQKSLNDLNNLIWLLLNSNIMKVYILQKTLDGMN